jgi:hypothetical protein
MSRVIMILVVGAIITYAYTNITLNEYTSQGTQNAVDNYSYNRAHDIANGMVDVILMRLANDKDYRVSTKISENLFGGEVSYSAENAFFDGDSLIKIIVSAKYNGVTKNITSYTEKPGGGWVPPVVRAAWTANADLNNTISDMYIDGRNHDLSQAIIPNTGVAGVSTSTDFTNVEFAEIGGTNAGVDYPMSYPEDPAVVEENYSWGGTFPESPDEILGYPEGTLKAAAQSGQYGSQYLLNPAGSGKNNQIDGLTYPVSGVTYIEITDGVEREMVFEELGNGGIFVVHAPDRSSRLKGLKMDKAFTEPFVGLIVTDYSFHHHIDILGGIMQLSPNLEDSKNCNGNKDHWVYYSSEAITQATETAAEITGLSANAGFGFGKKRVNVKHVYE